MSSAAPIIPLRQVVEPQTIDSLREQMDVPTLSGDNDWSGAQNFNGPVTVADEALTVTQVNGLVTKGIVFKKDPHVVTLGDPDWMSLTADRHLIPPDASGTLIVSGDAAAAGTILYHDGTAWKCLIAPVDGLPHTLTITAGVLSWS